MPFGISIRNPFYRKQTKEMLTATQQSMMRAGILAVVKNESLEERRKSSLWLIDIQYRARLVVDYCRGNHKVRVMSVEDLSLNLEKEKGERIYQPMDELYNLVHQVAVQFFRARDDSVMLRKANAFFTQFTMFSHLPEFWDMLIEEASALITQSYDKAMVEPQVPIYIQLPAQFMPREGSIGRFDSTETPPEGVKRTGLKDAR